MKPNRSYLALFVGLLPVLCYGQQHVQFSAPFAPSDTWVKHAEQPYREAICLNGSWQFEPVALPADFREGVSPVPSLPRITDGGWDKTLVRIPSPWNVNSFADNNGQGGDFRTYPSYPKEWEKIKMGWLRRKFIVPAKWKGERIQLHFEAVAGDAEILINGKPAGNHFGIFLPFDVDVTDQVIPGKENEISIGIRKASLFDKRGNYGRRTYQAGSFWGQHIAGIWQDVYIVAVPQVRAADVYIQSVVDSDRLKAQVTLHNDQSKEVTVSIGAKAYPWLSKAGKDIISAPNPSSDLGAVAALSLPDVRVKIPAHGNVKVTLAAVVKGKLKKWSTDDPNLYGLIVHTSINNVVTDSKYTRFGWRQFLIKDGQYLLNGKPVIMRGDSWHFLGIPQMTRRYAYAWFKALRADNLNAVRLHAQPYPSLYLDMADEMGILILDETAMWASDGGPKFDDPAYWKDSENHMAELVMRDRNHPSIFGWSISNEIMPVIVNVMHNPPGLRDILIAHYKIWGDTCRKLDPSRPWISSDGEDDGAGTLPTYMIHYGGPESMVKAKKTGKPWGVGEAGMAYYGTPEQVAATNGDRAYESFLGRMEGVAASSYKSLTDQREHDGIYRSVFNMVWYGLQPLPLGLKNTANAPTLDDGVYFTSYHEGQPGVQPERLGPYITTLNPGYDPSLPLYKTWPLFDAIHDANAAELPVGKWDKPKPAAPIQAKVEQVSSIGVIGGAGSTLAADLKGTGATIENMATPKLLFVDGLNPPNAGARKTIDQVLAQGGTVMVWGAGTEKLNALNALLPAPIELTSRSASSLLTDVPNVITSGISAADLYFSELRPPIITTQGLAGPLTQQSEVLIKANNTDWRKWNQQPEYAKTAMVVRSEMEAKPSGATLILKKVGTGRLLVTTLPVAPRLIKEQKVIGKILANLGVNLNSGANAGKSLLKNGSLVNAIVAGPFTADDAAKIDITEAGKGDAIKAGTVTNGKTWSLVNSDNGAFDLSKSNLNNGAVAGSVAYMSFWVFSPRSLEDLLLEPNLPTVTLNVAAESTGEVWLNGKIIIQSARRGGGNNNNNMENGELKSEPLKLHQGWNQFLVKVTKTNRGWQFAGRLVSNQPEFLPTLESSFDKP
jgi:beta-galactosidase